MVCQVNYCVGVILFFASMPSRVNIVVVIAARCAGALIFVSGHFLVGFFSYYFRPLHQARPLQPCTACDASA